MRTLKVMHWTKLDRLCTAVRRERRSRPDWRYGPGRVLEVAREGYERVKDCTPIVGRRYCDLGCGVFHPFGVSAVIYLNGAEFSLGLDLQRSDARRAAEALADLLKECLAFPEGWHWSELPRTEFIDRIRRFDLAALSEGNLAKGLGHLPLKTCITDIHNPVLAEESFDIMTSRAVLEHFLDFGRPVERIHALLRPGGVATHEIVIVDHRDYEGPGHHFWFFLAEEENWSGGLVNHLRSCELRPHFERAGFELLRYDTTAGKLPAGFRTQVRGRFMTMSDAELAITTVHCIIRKPAAAGLRRSA